MLTADDTSSNIIFLFHLVQIAWISLEEMGDVDLYIAFSFFPPTWKFSFTWILNLVVPKEAALWWENVFLGFNVSQRNMTYSPAVSYGSQSGTWCVCLRMCFQCERDSGCPISLFFDRRCPAPQRWQWEAVPERSSPLQPSFIISRRYWLFRAAYTKSCKDKLLELHSVECISLSMTKRYCIVKKF